MSASRIVITGATSGLGRELAVQYATVGADVILGLTGRRAERLEAVAAELRELGAEVHLYPVDVRDREAMQALAKDFVEQAGGVDLVIANAGMGNPDRVTQGDPALAADVIDVNVIGAINTLVPFLPTMKAQGEGHIVGVASVAGFRALPRHGAYSASKVALQYLLDSWDYSLRRHGICTTVINPGFVESEMTAEANHPQPFMMKTADAVKRMRWAIEVERRTYTFPRPMRFISWLLPWLPRWIIAKLS
jgi:short-subunit dehydrogenase